MPALCGSQGPMVCLYGAVCNETTGWCDNCPAGFRDDEVLYQGNRNCGLNEAFVIFVYVFTAVCSLLVAGFSLEASRGKKRSRMKTTLHLGFAWNVVFTASLLTHYLEGFRFGVATVVLNTLMLMIVNTQVSIVSYSMENFLVLVCNYKKTKYSLYFKEVSWYCFWMLNKLVFGMVMLIGAAQNNPYLFNAGQVSMSVSLIIEVFANIVKGFRSNRRLVTAVNQLHTDLKTDRLNPVVKEFAEKVQKTMYIGPIYGVFVLGLGTFIPVLFAIYDSSIPYVFILWSVIIIFQPVIGIGPILLLKSKLGAQLDKGSKSATRGGATATAPSDNSRADGALSIPGSPGGSTESGTIISKKTLKKGKHGTATVEDARQLSTSAAD
jgi:hypothetical protein